MDFADIGTLYDFWGEPEVCVCECVSVCLGHPAAEWFWFIPDALSSESMFGFLTGRSFSTSHHSSTQFPSFSVHPPCISLLKALQYMYLLSVVTRWTTTLLFVCILKILSLEEVDADNIELFAPIKGSSYVIPLKRD